MVSVYFCVSLSKHPQLTPLGAQAFSDLLCLAEYVLLDSDVISIEDRAGFETDHIHNLGLRKSEFFRRRTAVRRKSWIRRSGMPARVRASSQAVLMDRTRFPSR